jgi:two-component system, OmpR family, sensor kinase
MREARMFDLHIIVHQGLSGFPNIFRFRERATGSAGSGPDKPRRAALTRAGAGLWRRPWPWTARIPVVSGALILTAALAISRFMMTSVAHEQELGVRQMAAVYLDGIATTVYPHVLARNLANTTEAVRRTMWFHQGMREQRTIVQLPDGTVFADVSAPGAVDAADPLHDAALRRRLDQGDGFVFDESTGMGWASRAVVRDSVHVADLYVSVELKQLIEERQALQRKLLLAAVLSGLGAAALGFLIVRQMLRPVRLLTERLRRAQGGDFEPVSSAMLPSASSEYGRLLRGYNGLVDAIGEREALADRLAQRERESVLGRLAATIAHEVRNPLGGMSTALNTIRKFGDDPDIRAKGLDLIERGLWSIRDVVSSVLAFHRMPPDSRRLTAGDLDDLRVLVEPELTRRRLRLAWDCDIKGTVDVAATETRQIALNLLLNACEASSPGDEVSFRAWVDGDRDDGGGMELALQVVDGGPGLPEAVSAALTEIGVPDAEDPPRGLGIRVVRDLVRGLHGRIVATTASGDHGSRIVVALPVGARARREATT